MNRRDFLKATGVGGLAAAIGALLPRPLFEALAQSPAGPLTGWSRSIQAGDLLRISIDGVSSVGQVAVLLRANRVDDGSEQIITMTFDNEDGKQSDSQQAALIMPERAVIKEARIFTATGWDAPEPTVSMKIDVAESWEELP